MKKTVILILLLNTLIGYAQPTFKTGVNFPFYTPTAASINDYLSLVNQSGGKAIRQMTYADVFWKNIEPTNNNWNFTYSDSAFLNPFSLTPIGTLYSMMGNDTVGMQVPWLACSNPFTCFWDPANDSIPSKNYVLETVNRYKNVTNYWEIANEIESTLPPKGLLSMADKRDFLKYNYNWIKIADPTAKVFLPGLVGTCCTFPVSNSFSWLRDLLNVGGGSYFDIMNYHDYNAWWTLPAHYDSVQNILNQYNLNKPIWITETSISSVNTSPVTPSYSSVNEQAADVWRRICLLWAKGAEVVMWHSNWSSNDPEWREFGLVSNTGRKKKSFHSYKLLNDKISNFSSINILSLGNVTENNNAGGNGVWVIQFVVGGINKWVLWSPNNLTYSLTGISSSHIKVTEVVPNTLINNGDSAIFNSNIYTVNAGTYNFTTLTSLPILVEETTTTSLLENNLEKNIIIYPNPTNSILNINLNAIQSSDIKIQIADALGRVIFTKDLENVKQEDKQVSIDISQINYGMYFCNIFIDNQSIIKKFIIKQ